LALKSRLKICQPDLKIGLLLSIENIMTRYYLDSEFVEDGLTIDLVSIGIVCEDGREFYAENSDVNLTKASDWVKDKVKMADAVKDFMNPSIFRKPEIWTYYGSYDLVVFCQLFGKMMDVPDDFPRYTMDIKQWCKQLGDPELPKQATTEHNALNDALWTRDCYDFLNNLG
jgi:hypothetical protein